MGQIVDEAVLRSIAKWPNVPAVYGWLKLDRRGNWLIKGERIANQDTRSAEQAYMALDSLFRCYDNKIGEGAALNTGVYPSVGAAIDALNREFDNPSAYSAPRFAAGMKKVHVALQTAGIGPR